MEGFTYSNIFETKGIEYLVIIAFFAVLIPFWALLNRKFVTSRNVKTEGVLTSQSLQIPQGIFFSKFHTWTFLEKTGEAKVGLDDLLLHITGNVDFNMFKSPGEKIKKGEPLATIQYGEKHLRILSPISGEIFKTNELLSENAGIIKEDPYQNGWLFTIKPSNWKEDTNTCYIAEDASNWAIQELERFKEFLSVSVMKRIPEPVGIIMQDGGEILENPLAKLPQEGWKDFEEKFLT